MSVNHSFLKTAKSDYKLRHVCLSVSLQHFGSHGADFNEILYLKIFRKSVEKIPISCAAQYTF